MAGQSWWFPGQPGKEPCLYGGWPSNGNILTLDEAETCDPLTGVMLLSCLLVDVNGLLFDK
jgi:hypothetical protein